MPEPTGLKQEEVKDGDEKVSKDKAAACHVTAKVHKAEHASSTRALLMRIEREARDQGCTTIGTIKLRITIDGTGRIRSVVVVAGGSRLGAALVKALTDSTTATRAIDADTAILDVTVAMGSG
jgi:hypothetical protein